MKKIVIIILLLFSIFFEINAQVKELQISQQQEPRSLTIFYSNYLDRSQNTAVFIDGKQVSMMEFLSVNSKFIDTYSVEKKAITINGKEYKEQLYIKTKENYQPKRISLKDIREKYAKDDNLQCFYFIDDKVAMVNEKDIFLDENNILEICCHLYENPNENLKLNIIEIFTRSDKNIKDSKTMIIR